MPKIFLEIEVTEHGSTRARDIALLVEMAINQHINECPIQDLDRLYFPQYISGNGKSMTKENIVKAFDQD